LKINIISKLKAKKIDYRGEMDGFDFGLSLSIEDKIVNSQLDEEKKQRIGEAIKKLKKSQREVIYYFYFEDLDLPQIASLMHFSNPKSAQNLLYRSLGMLKKSLLVCWCLVLVHLILLVKL
jgi:DNA-directed RNA polymerase specialized sigma24 family protein